MNELVSLTRPLQSQISIDSVAKECPSEGFNYPTPRLLNKHARIYLSRAFELVSEVPYHLFDIANSKGWFAAVTHSSSGSELIVSTLEELRSSLLPAKEDEDNTFNPARIVSIPAKVNIVKFACGDTRLLVGDNNGSLLLYDTSQLFTEGPAEVHPITTAHIQSSYLRQIAPNPGTEPGLSDLVAVIAEGRVLLMNMQLEPQGGWMATDDATQPIAVDWSPKGKHIAIGIKSGDVLTFSPTNRSSPHKHIPPTANAPLASLRWLGPGHTFRTTYTESSPEQHIIVLDVKSSTATYFAPEHPYPAFDRTTQTSYTVSLPKWDTDSSSNDDSKNLTVVGDALSSDLEILGNAGNSWHRQSQDNPLTLPLDKSMNDTILIALEVDLTDGTNGAPIMYAYLNDGSLQGWYLEQSKPYAGMMIPGAASSMELTSPPNQEFAKDTEMSGQQISSSSAFGQQSTTSSVFGAPSFGGQTSSAFGQASSAFGQTGFGQKPAQPISAFGQSSFGQPSAFGAMASFSQPNQASTTTSAFGDVKPATGFGAFSGGSSSPFGGGATGAFGSSSGGGGSVFGSSDSGPGSVFGQSSFPVTASSPPSAQSNVSPSHSPTMTREASMSDSTPGFGGMGLGSANPSSSNAVNSMFGSFSTNASSSTSSQTTSAFGGSLLKPATGFGAFNNTTTSSAFNSKPATATTSAFGSSTQPMASSGFGQSGFAAANPAFGKPAFGQLTFGKPSMGPAAVSSPASGGFGAFAATPTSFASAAQNQSTAAPVSGGFGAFSSAVPSAFGSAASGDKESKPASTSAFSAFASNSSSAFGAAASTTDAKPSSTSGGAFSAFASTTPSPFGTASGVSNPPSGQTKSVFGGSSFPVTSTSPFGTPATSPFGGSAVNTPTSNDSPASSPEPSKSPFGIPNAAPTTPSTSHAFSNLSTTPSSFKPAAGFGAFANRREPKDSPFLKKPEEISSQPVSVFGLAATPKTPVSVSTAPTFGSPSALGVKSAFAPIVQPSTTPTKSPSTGGFGAFSGSSSGFAAFAGSKSSFSDLLKTGGEETTEPAKPALSDKVQSTQERVSVLGTPKTPPKTSTTSVISVFAPISKDKGKETSENKSLSKEPTFESISASSASSSFVEVNADETRGSAEQDSDEDAAHSDDDDVNSFLSEEDSYGEEDAEDDGLEEGEVEDEDDARSPSPESTAVPLTSSRSPSATPQPETPSIAISPSPDVAEAPSETPKKEAKSLFGADSSPQTPSPSSGPSPFGLGLGRPSTRPTRSSPLANAVSNEDEDDEDEADEDEADEKTITPSPKLPSLSPKVPVEILPLKSEDDKKGDSSSKRPKTPPLLSTLGAVPSSTPTPSLATPITPPVGKSSSFFAEPSPSSSKTTATPAGLPFGLGSQPSAMASAPSLLDKGKAPEIQPKPDLARATTAPTSIFGMPPPSMPVSMPKPVFSMPSFPPTSSQPSTNAPPNLFGIKSPTLPPMSGPGVPPNSFGKGPSPTSSTSSTQPPANISGIAGKQPSAAPFSLGAKPATPPKALSATPAPATPSPEAILEEGMQKECADLVMMVGNELMILRAVTSGTLMIYANKRAGGSRTADLGDKEKWGMGDINQFAQLLSQYQADLDIVAAFTETSQEAIREIQSNMVKATTRREEIARFTKAKDDEEFAKMLKSRTLGPEHSETQAQLRKSIKTIQDRVQKLEMRLQENKKKLAESTSLRPSFRAPTLDTINRTYRNIELTIEQQSNEVALLASRVARIKVEEPAVTPSPQPRDSRLPEDRRRPYNVTPDVAATTAAALNAERSAHRLKKALLAARKEPLLNTKASAAPIAPIAFETPRKPTSSDAFSASAFGGSPPSGGGGFAFQTPLKGKLFSSVPPPVTSDVLLDCWDIPEDKFNPTPLAETTTRRGAGGQRKHPSVPLKRSKGPSPAAPAGFEWGPLPTFSPPAASTGSKAFVPISATATPAGFTGFANFKK